MITLKSEAQIAKMREAGKLLYEVESRLRDAIQPGITTMELDRLAEKLIRDAGARPSFKGYNGFPWTICASPDEVVVHGFPNDEPLKEGHIISIDCGLVLHGWQADSAFTKAVGKIPADIEELIRVTEECFWIGAREAREGNRLGDIGSAIQAHAESHGFGVVRDLTGHGIGTEMHEDPSVPNFGKAGHGVRLRAGMCIAVEPMITRAGWRVQCADDGWTVSTRDKSWCSHYEHTLAITAGDPEILTFPGATLRRDIR